MAGEDWSWLRELAGPVGAAVLGFLSGRFTDRAHEKSDATKRDTDHEVAQITFDQAQMASISDRFKTLLDGYERRINDLVKEVEELRAQLRDAQAQLKDHMNARNAAP